MTSIQKGELAELKVQLRAVELGIITSKPSTPCRYDVVLDDGKQLLRAQVKYASGSDKRTAGGIRVRLVKARKNSSLVYTSNEIDLLLVYIPSIDKILKFHQDQFNNKQGLVVRLERPRNKQTRYRWFEDFLW